MPLPVIAIVGRPNVGKSSLLNALAAKRISIVQDMPGVTRDRVAIPLQIDGRWIEMVDTGGYGFVDPDNLTEHIKHQIEIALSRANLVLFIVDCQAGLTPSDNEIALLLRNKSVKTVLIANKADGEKADAALGEFARLGFGTPVGTSALRERNLDEVFDAIRKNFDLKSAPTELPEPQMLLAIVGKRNAGKSTLVNAIARLYEGDPERVIVSEVPGTTRDSVDVRFEKEGKTLIVIDTAGVRKKKHMVTNDIEFYSFHRAQRSIRRADVVLLLVDGTEPVSEPDKKLAQYIAGEFKPVIIVVNKWDLTRTQGKEIDSDDEKLMEDFGNYLAQELPNIDYAPVAFVTAKDGRNIQGVVDLAQHLFKQANERVGTGRLNAAVRSILDERHPSTPTGRRARIYYATQTDVSPPTIVLFVNKPEFVDAIYQRFMINRFRETLPYAEVPIKLVVRGKSAKDVPPGEAVAPSRPVKRPLKRQAVKKTLKKTRRRK
ncbi:MAG: ribosome biogenesis GTPase Der [Phycisphaerae bacterium]|nr:ribosome biogenesis GTPase Der [Phycisphaerae bacterium]